MTNKDDIINDLQEQGVFKERDLSNFQPIGLVEHSHTILVCSNCSKNLIDICIVRPEEEYVWNIIAECPFCGDASFQTTITGGFLVGYCEGVKLSDYITDGNNVRIKTIKTIKT